VIILAKDYVEDAAAFACFDLEVLEFETALGVECWVFDASFVLAVHLERR